MSSTGATKMALFREKQKLNLLTPLPKTYTDVLTPAIPTSLTHMADNTEFIMLKSWTNNTELEGIMVFLSDMGSDVLRRSAVWMMDGTYSGSRSLLSGNHHISI